MKLLFRERLVEQVQASQAHVLLCAPTGYGKSVLLEQLHEVLPDSVLINATREDSTPAILTRTAQAGARVCLVDDAHLLDPDTVTALLGQPTPDVRFVLAVRHQAYRQVVNLWQRRKLLLLDAEHLAFSGEELHALDPSLIAPDVLRRTLGWPAMVSVERLPLASMHVYLADLLEAVPDDDRRALLEAAGTGLWDRALLAWQRAGELPRLLDSGVPVVTQGGQLMVHPALQQALEEEVGGGAQLVRPPDEVLQTFLEAIPHAPHAHRVALMERYFARHGEDDLDIPLKLELLGSVDVRQLTPHLRDLLASYLATSGELDGAQHVLSVQQDLRTDSTYTHTLLGQVASGRSDFAAFAEHLALARERAVTDLDWARYHGSHTTYLMRLSRYAEALEATEQYHRAALRTGRMDLHISALSQNAYVRYFAGQLQRARDTAYEALALAEREGLRFAPQLALVLYNLAEISKDAGNHTEAMTLVQKALVLTSHSPTNTTPFLYNTRGLIYLEYGQFQEAVDSFEAAIAVFRSRPGHAAGLMMPHTYAAYALHRLGHQEEMLAHVRALREVAQRVSAGQAEYAEHRAYLPLAEGLARLALGQPEQALAAFDEVLTEGTLGYDSVLLTRLEAARVRVEQGAFTARDAWTLVEVLDARCSEEDVTARMYADAYRAVYAACADLQVHPERFRRLASATGAVPAARPTHTLRLTTLGRVTLEANGVRVVTRSLAPLYALAYLHFQGDWSTTDALGEHLFRSRADARGAAFKSISELRRLLQELDHEVERRLLSPSRDPRGYRLEPGASVRVEVDVEAYLGEAFTPEGGDPEHQLALLRDLAVFLPRLDCPFASEMNAVLADRAVQVARHLSGVYRARGEGEVAATAVLYALRFTPDPELAWLLETLSSALPPQAACTCHTVVQAVTGEREEHLADLVTAALHALAGVEVGVEGCGKEPGLP
ncbi:tetratricopeptide repeat protein [Deinococcus aluminii]|uniref:Tetratricopeptide repeat protein n=1 Tax=Deinococcus aluminii TaxID=1656885 RepID=A0ABP9XG10_9DEIO